MANSVESILPAHIRKTFEQFGVIKMTAWPKLDVLIKAITSRKYRFDLESDPQGVCTARVFAFESTYTAVDGEPERALARAFYDCLKVTGSAQLGMFNGDDSDDDEDDEDAVPDLNQAAREFRGSMQRMADEDGVTTTLSIRGQSATIGPTKRTVNGETFERDDLGRYVNTETGEYLDAFEVPRPMTAGR